MQTVPASLERDRTAPGPGTGVWDRPPCACLCDQEAGRLCQVRASGLLSFLPSLLFFIGGEREKETGETITKNFLTSKKIANS